MKKKVSDQVGRDEASKVRQRYQNLLQDYLELQKDFVSSKKKLEAAHARRRLLAGEVRFLRRRYKYLLILQSTEVEAQVGHSENANRCDKQDTNERNHPVSESDKAKICEGAEESRLEALKKGEKQKNCLTNSKTFGKRKISWQDPVALTVYAFTH